MAGAGSQLLAMQQRFRQKLEQEKSQKLATPARAAAAAPRAPSFVAAAPGAPVLIFFFFSSSFGTSEGGLLHPKALPCGR